MVRLDFTTIYPTPLFSLQCQNLETDVKSALLLNDDSVDIANGRYVVIGEGGKAVVQNDDFSAAVDAARAMGITSPAVVNLEMTREFIPLWKYEADLFHDFA